MDGEKQITAYRYQKSQKLLCSRHKTKLYVAHTYNNMRELVIYQTGRDLSSAIHLPLMYYLELNLAINIY